MLTIFSTCKPLEGLSEIHQSNAIRSWQYIRPKPEVFIFGSEAGVYDICQETGFKQITGIARVDQIPLLDDIFKKAQAQASNDLVCYANGDVVVVDGLVEAIRRADEFFDGKFLLVCRRWDVELDDYVVFDRRWKADMVKLITEGGELHSKCSSDIFAFRRPLWEMPGFAVGRPGWDNWTMWKATDVGWPVVDATPVVTLAHPIHGYGPEAKFKQAHHFWRESPLAMRNAHIMGKGHQYCFVHVRKAGYLWRMSEKAIYKVEHGD